MNIKLSLTAFIVFATILLTSCSTRQYVIYSVNNITLPPETAKTIPINVNVRILTDNRVNIENNKVLFTNNSRETTIDNKVFCINAEKYYRKETVVNLVTKMLVKHFNKAKLFTNTNYNDDLSSSYYLTGTLIKDFGNFHKEYRCKLLNQNNLAYFRVIQRILC